MTAIVQNVVTSGVFELDGGSWDVDNNVWLIGDDQEVLVIDAAHNADTDRGRDRRAQGDRHRLHPRAQRPRQRRARLARRTGAPILLHPEDRVLWDLTHADRAPDGELADGQELTVAGTRLKVIHTPGHAPARSACTQQT